jgi:hypothetical protein
MDENLIGLAYCTEDVLEDFLTSFEKCPICGSADRQAMPPAEEFHNRYTNAMAAYTDTNPKELLAKIAVFKCDGCSTEYCDPWIKRDFAAELYGVVMGQHRFGWWAFDQWASNKTEYSTSSMKRDALWASLLEHAGQIDNYAEINCPFAGFTTYFDNMNGALEETERVEISDFIIGIRETYHESDQFTGWPKKLDRKPPPAPAPQNRYLIREPSSYFWGNNCVHQNTSCHAMATMLFNIKITSFAEIEDDALTFDVIGLFQALDHFVDPMTVLRQALKAARVVIIVGHNFKSIIHKQHQFQFGSGLSDYLRGCGLSVMEIPEEVIAENVGDDQNSNCFLVSEKIEFTE